MRRKARETVLKILYSLEFDGGNPEDRFNELSSEDGIQEDCLVFAKRLLLTTLKYREEADKLIEDVLENWELNRIPLVELSILRMGVAEMEFFPENPVEVIINEAVELAKRFVSIDAGRFVNGILDRIARKKGLV